MKTNIHELQAQAFRFATEAVSEHLAFTGLPDWAKGHEDETKHAFEHYAQIGAREAINYLNRNGKL